MAHSQVAPRMLQTASTSHSWAFGALAELVDNAQDQECGATKVWIEGHPRGFLGTGSLTVEDNGYGVDLAAALRMMSYGFSDKENVAGNVGRYGMGFKSGSMRLGKDALVVSKSRGGTATIALLSRTFLEATGKKEIMIPMFSWQMVKTAETSTAGGAQAPARQRISFQRLHPESPAVWDAHMKLLFQFSPFASEEDCLQELRSLKGATGTRILLYNLRQPLEFDFSERDDIRIRNIDDSKGNFKLARANQNDTTDVPEDYSLRAYLAVLYLRARVELVLQCKLVQPSCPIARLDTCRWSAKPFRPRDHEKVRVQDPVKITLGYASDNPGKMYGVHLYNKNRLIRMYERFGAQQQANCMWKTMLGVMEADCLQPSHTKQEFDISSHLYKKVTDHLRSTMKFYYENIQTVTTAGLREHQRHKAQSKRQWDYSSDEDEDDGGQRQRKAPRAAEGARAGGAAAAAAAERAGPSGRSGAGRLGRKLGEWYEECAAVLNAVRRKSVYSFWYEKPVDPIELGIPDYFDVVKEPMSFSEIEAALPKSEPEPTLRNPRGGNAPPAAGAATQYTRPEQFEKDMRQVFFNACLYNAEHTKVHRTASMLSAFFQEQWEGLLERTNDFEAARDAPAPAAPPAELHPPAPPGPVAAPPRPPFPAPAGQAAAPPRLPFEPEVEAKFVPRTTTQPAGGGAANANATTVSAPRPAPTLAPAPKPAPPDEVYKVLEESSALRQQLCEAEAERERLRHQLRAQTVEAERRALELEGERDAARSDARAAALAAEKRALETAEEHAALREELQRVRAENKSLADHAVVDSKMVQMLQAQVALLKEHLQCTQKSEGPDAPDPARPEVVDLLEDDD